MVEEQNFESRKNILKYDDVMNSQRTVIYRDRRQILEGVNLRERIVSMIETVVGEYVRGATAGPSSEWDLDQLWTALSTLYPVDLEKPTGPTEQVDARKLSENVVENALAAYQKREDELGEVVIRELERRVLLSVLDRKWREHLYEMDYLREGIGLRAYSQRDPLVEYQSEGYEFFRVMMEGIAEESLGYLFNLDVQVTAEGGADEAPVLSAKGLDSDSEDPIGLTYSAPDEDGSAVSVAGPGESYDEDDDPGAKARLAKEKARARAKAKTQRQSRKRNR